MLHLSMPKTVGPHGSGTGCVASSLLWGATMSCLALLSIARKWKSKWVPLLRAHILLGAVDFQPGLESRLLNKACVTKRCRAGGGWVLQTIVVPQRF